MWTQGGPREGARKAGLAEVSAEGSAGVQTGFSYEVGESRPFVGRDLGGALEGDHGAPDPGGRGKSPGRYPKESPDPVHTLKKQAQSAPGALTWPGTEFIGYFGLHHDHARSNRAWPFQNAEERRPSDAVREVAHEVEWLERQVYREKIAHDPFGFFSQGEAFQRFQQACINLDAEVGEGLFEEVAGELALAGADFEEGFAR